MQSPPPLILGTEGLGRYWTDRLAKQHKAADGWRGNVLALLSAYGPSPAASPKGAKGEVWVGEEGSQWGGKWAISAPDLRHALAR